MPHEDLVARVKRHLEHQIVWLEKTLRNLERIEHDLDEAVLDEVAERHAHDAALTAQYLRECEALLHEWGHVEDIADADREEVRALADRVEELIAKVTRRYEEAARIAGERLDGLREAYGALHRSRQTLRRYRPGGDHEPGFLDKKA
ncbi:MAG TPA: hypothetical protein PKL84_01760 [Candidatus Hydrogenedentes bacterium]|nr:hypothetical protein [Candidatus Hydrogenedentota bacterium]